MRKGNDTMAIEHAMWKLLEARRAEYPAGHDVGHALRVLRYIHANPRAAGVIVGNEYVYSNYRSYTRPADDGLSAWHPAYLRLGPTPDGCAGRYEQFCRRYRPEPKEQRRSRWGGWHLWRGIEGGTALDGGQGDLFGVAGASYRGGGRGRKRVGPVAVLRPGVLAEVERFIVVNQPSRGRHGRPGSRCDLAFARSGKIGEHQRTGGKNHSPAGR